MSEKRSFPEVPDINDRVPWPAIPQDPSILMSHEAAARLEPHSRKPFAGAARPTNLNFSRMLAQIYRNFAALLLLSACDLGSSSPEPLDLAIPQTDDTWVRKGPAPVETHGALQVDGTDLKDARGQVVQLRGVSSMWLNWENDGYAESADALVWMRDNWNLSVIRAAMGVEPNGAYLTNPEKAKAQVQRIVENAVAAGVYVIIDWHDHGATERLDQAVAFFSEMAERYAGVPNLIYEPFNEPLAIDWESQLKPYHEAVVAAIREQDSESVIVLGTPKWSQDVDVAARSPVSGTNLMYALHFYACTHGAWLRSKAESARAKGLALFVTEWGATHADGGLDGLSCLEPARDWIDFMNQANISWTAWKLDNCAVDSTCLLAVDAPLRGGWDTPFLHGHASFVRDAMRR